MTTVELVEILQALDAGMFTRQAACDAMVARGAQCEYAEETLALHLGESQGDVIE